MVFKLVFQQNKQGTEHSERITKLISQTEYMEYGLRVSEHRYWNGSYETLLPACVLRAKSLRSCLTLCNPWTVAHQALLSMGILSRQEYCSGLSCPPPWDLPNPEIKPTSLCLLHWQVDSLPLPSPGKPWLPCKAKWNQHGTAQFDCHVVQVAMRQSLAGT